MKEKHLYLPQASQDRILAAVGPVWTVLGVYLVVINLLAFAAFGVDKRQAKRKERRPEIRRVPEKTLFLLAALGGTPGAWLGMKVFHHKTLHRAFRLGIPALFFLQLLTIAGLYWYYA